MPAPVERHARRTSFRDCEEQKKKPETECCKLPPRYTVGKQLGRGSYGRVFEAKDSMEGREVAIKKIVNLFDDGMDCKRILREISILSRLNHEHIVKIYDIPAPGDLEKFNELHIVMEKSDTDFKKLCRDPKLSLTPPHVNTLLYNLLLGLHYLHTAGIYHRDLTPGNCLVNRDLTVKICDFGLSRAVGAVPPAAADPSSGRRQRDLTAHVVTRWYRAPELILLQDHYSAAIDVWSAGCIFAELLGLLRGGERGPLFPGKTCFPMSPDPEHEADSRFHTSVQDDQMNVIFNVLGMPAEDEVQELGSDARKYLRRFEKRQGSGLRSKFDHVQPEAVDILEKMLRFAAGKRLRVTEAFAHDLLKDYREPTKETPAESMVILDFEAEKELGEARLRHYFSKEIRRFHPELPEL
eukprot:CAMPEP_0171109502 /NCGR_PEP_ID=MMETSP0766_2-20121228/70815_1 /TAXON_ID=439317 /ORGANISM="Gambierdiscus australes, Strain CAWD 149" /LENGTH=409 /DNA_ID=CAMNT_0011571247 /DNA_START=52 /DNA_END=1281 /DNA_ORIENTATION=-